MKKINNGNKILTEDDLRMNADNSDLEIEIFIDRRDRIQATLYVLNADVNKTTVDLGKKFLDVIMETVNFGRALAND